MKIISIVDGKELYNTGGTTEVKVSPKFWELCRKKGIRYHSGGKKGQLLYSKICTLKISDDNFEDIFLRIINSELAKTVMRGELPVDTVL